MKHFWHSVIFVSLIILFNGILPSESRMWTYNRHYENDDTLYDAQYHDGPYFAEPVHNVTVAEGKDALLTCVVDNVTGFKAPRVSWQVAWVKVNTQTILSVQDSVISQNPRYSLTYNNHRIWYLHIKNVQQSDRGWYMCQINTDPMRSRQGYLQVLAPPKIVDAETSSDIVVRESSNVTMKCKAVGYPEPYVVWRREDGLDVHYNGEKMNVVDGDVLSIVKVSRVHMGTYLCIASNGIPPSISKRISLKVQFPPMLTISNQLEAAYVGQNVTLECRSEAHPSSINYWTTERGDMIVSDMTVTGDKYETISKENNYQKRMQLKIRNVDKNDFGTYRCVAKNSLGETDGLIRLEETVPPLTTARMETDQVEGMPNQMKENTVDLETMIFGRNSSSRATRMLRFWLIALIIPVYGFSLIFERYA